MELPKHTKVKLVTIYGEELDAVIIPLSIKGAFDVETFIDDIKNRAADTDLAFKKFKKSLAIENSTDDELRESYVDSRITMDLLKLNEEITEDRIKSQRTKRALKLTDGKTRDELLNELANIAVEMDTRKNLMAHTISRTLWSILRKPDNLREHTFKDVDELQDSLDTDTLLNIFKDVNATKVDDETLKN